jgi:hypothetical protein
MAWGVVGGPGLAVFYGNKDIANAGGSPKAIGACGLSFQYNFTYHCSLYSEVSFEQKGEKLNSYYFLSSTRLNYLTIPVLFKAGFGKKVYFYGMAGPYLGILLNAQGVYDNPNVPMRTKYSDVTSSFKRIDAGISAGVGMRIFLKKYLSFTIENKNNIGLYTISHFLYSSNAIKNFSSLFEIGIVHQFGAVMVADKKSR